LNLAFKTPRPNNVVADEVVEQARVAALFRTWAEFFVAPFVLKPQMVTRVLNICGQVAESDIVIFRVVAIDVNHAVMDLKDFRGIFVLGMLCQKGVPTVEGLAVEQSNPTGVSAGF
jgi:hypothetical protein